MRAPVVLSLLLVGCSGGTGSSTPARTGPIVVKATSHPAGYLARRVGAAEVKVDVIVPDGEDPAAWQPSGEVVAGLSEADLIVANGAGFERWMATATLPTAKVVEAARGVDTISVEGPTHSHGKEGEHSHGGVDPHTWADPAVYAAQADVVHAALVQADPGKAALYDAHLAGFKRQLDELGTAWDAVLAQIGDTPVAANHPAFTYLARRGGLTLPSLHLDPSEAPSPEQAQALAEAHPADLVVWWEARPSDAVQAALPGTWTHIVVDPLEQPRPDSGYDYVAQTKINQARLDAFFPVAPAADTDAPSDTDAPTADTDAPGPAAAP